jgi:hypothetical protein
MTLLSYQLPRMLICREKKDSAVAALCHTLRRTKGSDFLQYSSAASLHEGDWLGILKYVQLKGRQCCLGTPASKDLSRELMKLA